MVDVELEGAWFLGLEVVAKTDDRVDVEVVVVVVVDDDQLKAQLDEELNWRFLKQEGDPKGGAEAKINIIIVEVVVIDLNNASQAKINRHCKPWPSTQDSGREQPIKVDLKVVVAVVKVFANKQIKGGALT